MFSLILLIFYIFCDVNYFIKLAFTFGMSWIQKKVGINYTTQIYGLCTTQDVDFFLTHMNNARYLRDLDFARIHFFKRTGLYARCIEMGAQGLLRASNIRYRRSIPIFSLYKVETKMVYCETNMLCLEHKFITLRDGFVRAVVLSRTALVGCDTVTLLRGLQGAAPTDCPPDLHHWLQSMEISSEKLRKNE